MRPLSDGLAHWTSPLDVFCLFANRVYAFARNRFYPSLRLGGGPEWRAFWPNSTYPLLTMERWRHGVTGCVQRMSFFAAMRPAMMCVVSALLPKHAHAQQLALASDANFMLIASHVVYPCIHIPVLRLGMLSPHVSKMRCRSTELIGECLCNLIAFMNLVPTYADRDRVTLPISSAS